MKDFLKALKTFLLPTLLFGILGFPFTSDLHGAEKDKSRWDQKYSDETYLFGKDPIPFLKEYFHLLPKGKAVDLAMGEGRNGVYLAVKGFDVVGLDISEKGLRKAHQLADEHGVTITTKVVDLETYQLKQDAYDVVLCTYYLQRTLFPKIKKALKSGGIAVVETYTLRHRKYSPRFPEQYLLKPNELLTLLEGLIILRYQVIDDGKAAYASILAQKP